MIGLGTVKFGRNTGVKYPSRFSIPGDDELRNLLAVAWEQGINYIDTAPAYGSSEERLGRLVGSTSNDWVISTKVGEYFEAGESHFDFSSEQTIKRVEHSLRTLKRDALDIVYVHSDGEDADVIQSTDVIPTLLKLKQQGLIKAVGFSGKDAKQSALALDSCDVFMITLNEQDKSQVGLIELCQKHQKGVVIKKALASGHSSDPKVALNFACNYPGVASVIVGTINEAHLRDNVNAVTSA